MITFYWPWMFLLLPLPLLFRLWAKPLTNQASSQMSLALKLPAFDEIQTLYAHERFKTMSWKTLIIPSLIWLLLVTSAAQPLWLDKEQPTPVSGRDMILVIDISGSMRQMDFERPATADIETQTQSSLNTGLSSQNVDPVKVKNVSRLEVVKQVAAKFVSGRHGDRIGLILFGDKPYLRASPTYDHQAILNLIKESEIALAGESTAIGDAIGLAIKRMNNLESQNRVIVLLTDGANNEGMLNPRSAAKLAALEGMRIYTIGIGKQKNPGPNPYGVWTSKNARQFEAEVLTDVARLADGQFFHALDTEGLQSAYKHLDQLEPALSEDSRFFLAQPLYPWTLAAVLIIILYGILKARLPFHRDLING